MKQTFSKLSLRREQDYPSFLKRGRAVPLWTLFALLFLMPMSNLKAQYAFNSLSQSYTVSVSSTGTQCTEFENWRKTLTRKDYRIVKIRNNLTKFEAVSKDAKIVQAMADFLRTASSTPTLTSWKDGNNQWDISTCGGIEISMNSGSCACSGTDNATFRPCIVNSNWGGVQGSTCGAASQTLTLEFGWYAGFNNTLKYRNLDFTVNMRGAFNYQIINEARMNFEGTQNGYRDNRLTSVNDKVFGKTTLSPSVAAEFNSYYIEDGDYWKIDNITMGYTFEKFSKSFKSIRVYGSVNNAFIITSYKGIDPEVNTSGLDPGIDRREKFPTVRTFALGLTARF